MTVSKHNGLYSVGDIIGYPGSYSTVFYGYKLLQKVWVEKIEAYVWLGQYGLVGVNKFSADNDGKTISLLTESDIKNDYASTWTPTTEYKKGDVLTGKDGDKDMLFVYFSDTHVERLTPRNDLWAGDRFGHSTLADYSENFGPLEIRKVQKPGLSGGKKKFSDM